MLVTLNEVLVKAQKGKYAVGLFNTINMEMLEAAISAAEEERSPIILGTAEVLLPYGELKLISPSVIEMAKKATVPVVVHYDHGLTFDRVLEAIKCGFSSVMYDCSTLSPKENIEATREIVKIAHSFGVSVEAEIGHVGGAEDSSSDSEQSSMYTTVSEAVDFSARTNVDALAIAIGTAHGNYIRKPVLDVGRLLAIHNAVATPLVLHGGSGLSEQDFRDTIANGISKVNIFTDLTNAGIRAMKDGIDSKKSFLDIRNLQVEYIKNEIIKKMRLFGCNGKA